jgi:carbon storage regulator
MLVLTQKEGEILQIGDDVRIYIKRVKGNWVRLCIDAPREVALLRIPADKARSEPRPARKEAPAPAVEVSPDVPESVDSTEG